MMSHQYLILLVAGLAATQAGATCVSNSLDGTTTVTSSASADITTAPPTSDSSCSTTASNCYYSYTTCSGTFSFYSK